MKLDVFVAVTLVLHIVVLWVTILCNHVGGCLQRNLMPYTSLNFHPEQGDSEFL